MSSQLSRGASGILLAVATAPLVLPPSSFLVEAGFSANDFLPFLGKLPAKCNDDGVVASAATCFTTAQGCTCFDDAFVAPAIPSALPTTCEEAQGDMTRVVCAMMECCPPCADDVMDLWSCVAEGTDGIVNDCAVDCAAESPAVETPVTGPPQSPSEGAGVPPILPDINMLPEGCREVGNDLMTCVEGLNQDDVQNAMACMQEEASVLGLPGGEGLPTPCGIIEMATCTISECIPSCVDQVTDVQTCVADSDMGCDFNCDGGVDKPPPSMGDGDFMNDPTASLDFLAPECQPLVEAVGTCIEGLGGDGADNCETCMETKMEEVMSELLGGESDILSLIFGSLMTGGDMDDIMEGGGGTTPVVMSRMSDNGEEGAEMMFDEGMLENFFCGMIGGVVCTTKDCCPTCSEEIDDVIACVKSSGGISVPDFGAMMEDLPAMMEGGTTGMPDMDAAVQGGMPQEPPPMKMVSCDVSCESTTETTAPASGGATTAAPGAPTEGETATTTTEAPGTDGLETRSGSSGRSTAMATAAAVGGLILTVV